ncbi:hypothetical protein LCGC14_2886840 [marine sediment metagenome]|uniref:Uncharacterized protein n=1 Tax=marine sediment metagenome TaxID=412755 RepID=A0A0F9API8_9ZZZZ
MYYKATLVVECKFDTKEEAECLQGYVEELRDLTEGHTLYHASITELQEEVTWKR